MKKVSGGTTTLYFYDTEGKLIEEYIPATGMGKDYLWMPKSYEPVARVDFSMTDADTGDVLRCSKSSPNVHLDWSLFSGGGNFVMRRGIIGNFSSYSNIFGPSSMKTCDDPVLENTMSYWYDTRNRSLTDTLYFYHCDHLGTPLAMTDTSGALVWRAEHTPFGGIYALTVGTIANNLRFPGQYYDSETSLAQNWFRDYEAKIGRYWEPDPIGFASRDTNLYDYCFHNPINNADYTGFDSWTGSVVGFGGTLVLVGGSYATGITINLSTGEICQIQVACMRVGPGLSFSAGATYSITGMGPHCGKDLEGPARWGIGGGIGNGLNFAFSATYPQEGTAHGSLKGGTYSFSGLIPLIQPPTELGFGGWMGVVGCWTFPGDCSNTPCECK